MELVSAASPPANLTILVDRQVGRFRQEPLLGELCAQLASGGSVVEVASVTENLISMLSARCPALVLCAVSDVRYAGGTLQDILNLRKVAYAGSSAGVLHECQDARNVNALLRRAGLPVPKMRVISSKAAYEVGLHGIARDAMADLGSPVRVRPSKRSKGFSPLSALDAQALHHQMLSYKGDVPQILLEAAPVSEMMMVLVGGPPDGMYAAPVTSQTTVGRSRRQATERLSIAAAKAAGCADFAVVSVAADISGALKVYDIDASLDLSPGGSVGGMLGRGEIVLEQVVEFIRHRLPRRLGPIKNRSGRR